MSTTVTVYAVSDMTGETVERIVRAASAQFPRDLVAIKVLQHIQSAEQIVAFIERQADPGDIAVFHTILSQRTREDLRQALQTLRIPSVDLLGSTAHVMADLLGVSPHTTPGITIDDGSEPAYFDLGA